MSVTSDLTVASTESALMYFPRLIKNRGLCCAPQIFAAAAHPGPPRYTRPKGTPKNGNLYRMQESTWGHGAS